MEGCREKDYTRKFYETLLKRRCHKRDYTKKLLILCKYIVLFNQKAVPVSTPHIQKYKDNVLQSSNLKHIQHICFAFLHNGACKPNYIKVCFLLFKISNTDKPIELSI